MQVIAPNLDSLVRDLEANRGEIRTHVIGDYLLKLSITSTYIWLLGFYAFFHCFLNLSAELLRFGDRGKFFRDYHSQVATYPLVVYIIYLPHTKLSIFSPMKQFSTGIGGMLLKLVHIGACGTCQSTIGLFVMYTFPVSGSASPRLEPHLLSSFFRPSYTNC